MAVKLLEVPAEIIEDALDLELKTARSSPTPSTGALHLSRRAASGRARHGGTPAKARLGSLPWPAIDAAKAIPWVESKAGVTLAESQRRTANR